MSTVANCDNLEVASTNETRNYLIVPDHESCGVSVRYYGRGCQFMELRSLRREILGAATTRYTWNRDSNTLCRIGEIRDQPGRSRMVLRLLEPCEPGIPLGYWLADEACTIRAVNNHGLCGGGRRTIVNAWTRFFEVFDFRIQRMEMDELSNFEGTTNVRLVEFLVELEQTFAGGALYFSEIDVDFSCAAPEFCDFAFGCKKGCGKSACGCLESCDDGTQSLYVPYYCPVDDADQGPTQHIAYALAGGQVMGNIQLPDPVGGVGTASTCPLVVATTDTLYVLANENPVEVYEVPLDSNGLPEEARAVSVATLTSATGDTTGTPAQIVIDNDTLYALVADADGGARLYSDTDWTTPLEEFSTLYDYEALAVCGSRIIVGGFTAQALMSDDGGNTFAFLSPPVGPGSSFGEFRINDIAIVDGRIWLGLSDGRVFSTADDGFTWTAVDLGIESVANLVFNGTDVGWIGGSSGLQSTWLGGLDADLWTGDSPRLANWPEIDKVPVGASRVVVPECATGILGDNTVAALLEDGRVLVGRARVSGV